MIENSFTSEWVRGNEELVETKHSTPQCMPFSRTALEKYQGKEQKMKEMEWFSFPLSIYMKNVRSRKCLLPPMYLSAHFQEAWPHPGHWLAGEQRLTQHIRSPWSPRLGGLLLFLWLNSQAGRAGAAPNDSWVLKSHARPHREGWCSLWAAASHSSPQSRAPSPHSSAHYQQLTTKGDVRAEGCSGHAHLSQHWVRQRQWDGSAPPAPCQLPQRCLSQAKDAPRKPCFQGCTHWLPKNPVPKGQPASQVPRGRTKFDLLSAQICRVLVE